MVMVTASGQECRLPPVPLRFLETQDVPVESDSSFQIGHFEVDVPDPGLRSNRPKIDVLSHKTNLPHLAGPWKDHVGWVSILKTHAAR